MRVYRLALLFTAVLGILLLSSPNVFADQIEMQNGERFIGKVLSMNADSIVLQSEVLGKVSVPRAKVATISLGSNVATVAPTPAPSTNQIRLAGPSTPITNADLDISAALRQLGANTNFIEQIRGQFLSDAGPDANGKFDELLSGLKSGNVNIASLRAQAKSSADQLRALRKDLGPDAGDSLDTYLGILDSFLRETAGNPPLATNSAASAIH
jgi:hypothetical protein